MYKKFEDLPKKNQEKLKNSNVFNSYVNSDLKSLKMETYFQVYDEIFKKFINKNITFVEIGVLNGGSLKMWKNYFGDNARIIGIDLNPKAKELEKISKGFSQTETGLRYKIIQEGTGEQASAGKKVSVHYKGELLDGTVFDSSYKRQEPIDFVLGQGQVIAGWDEGVSLLKVGDKARFLIPSDLAYGSKGAGGVIPSDADLLFDVELVAII